MVNLTDPPKMVDMGCSLLWIPHSGSWFQVKPSTIGRFRPELGPCMLQSFNHCTVDAKSAWSNGTAFHSWTTCGRCDFSVSTLNEINRDYSLRGNNHSSHHAPCLCIASLRPAGIHHWLGLQLNHMYAGIQLQPQVNTKSPQFLNYDYGLIWKHRSGQVEPFPKEDWPI